MPGRFSLFTPQAVLEDRFDANAVEPITPHYNIQPREDLATIRNDAPNEIDHLRWGLIPHWVTDLEDWLEPINARSESVAENRIFKSAFADRRCLILADGYFEWKGPSGNKQPYRIRRVDDDPFAFAGVWESWTPNGEELDTVALITTEPNDIVAPIHDRMPVILEPDEEQQWLEQDDTDGLQALLDPYPNDLLETDKVSKAVNNPNNDSPDIVEPIDDDQSEFDEF